MQKLILVTIDTGEDDEHQDEFDTLVGLLDSSSAVTEYEIRDGGIA